MASRHVSTLAARAVVVPSSRPSPPLRRALFSSRCVGVRTASSAAASITSTRLLQILCPHHRRRIRLDHSQNSGLKLGSSIVQRRYIHTPSDQQNVQPELELQSSCHVALYNSLSDRVERLHGGTGHAYGHDARTAPSTMTFNTSKLAKGLACYTCGPTVYGPAHLGHARTYVWIDILRRILESETTAQQSQHQQQRQPHQQYAPLFVLNITDVDDKILQASSEQGIPPLQLARRYEAEFWRDWDALNCLRPHVVTRVSEYVESDIIPYIQRLLDVGMAYEVNHTIDETPRDDLNASAAHTQQYNGVYFDVRAYEEKMGMRTRYGKLAPSSSASTADTYQRAAPASQSNTMAESESLRDSSNPLSDHAQHIQSSAAASGSSSGGYKRDDRDFALWKGRKSGESLYWDSSWGPGRPGWHIECSAMIQAVAQQFGDTHRFTLHAGGVDLKFPHHTNEIAQAEAYHHCDDDADAEATVPHTQWIAHWIHTGHLHIDGHKMSKSLKNFVTIQDFLAGDATASTTEQVLELEDGSADMVLEGKLTAATNIHPCMLRADDFRLWCLGLSGSYRGLAVYSAERMQEARNVRNKIVRFLLQGEEWVRRRNEKQQQQQQQQLEQVSIDSSSRLADTKKWSVADCAFHASINQAVVQCRHALRSDLDGSTCVEQMVLISESGVSYMNDKSATAVEPMRFALQSIRSLLELVGFTKATWQAGIQSQQDLDNGDVKSEDGNSSNASFRALIQEVARFRSAIRRAAIEDHKRKDGTGKGTTPSDNVKRILKLCDQARDETFPALGIEFIDERTKAATVDDEEEAQGDWRFCIPRQRVSKTEAVAMNSAVRRAIQSEHSFGDVPPDELFKVGPYQGIFSAYNADGFPLCTADGAELSNTQTKKLRKVFVRHVTQLQRRAMKKDSRDNAIAKRNQEYRTFQADADRLTHQLAKGAGVASSSSGRSRPPKGPSNDNGTAA